MKQKNIKTALFTGFCVLLSFVFTSCIDYVQTITVDGENYNSYYKISIPNILLDAADMDAEEFFEQFEDLEAILPFNSEINEIDNGEDVGIEFYVSVNVNTDDEIEQEFIPYARNDGSEGFLPFFIGNFPEVFEELLYAEGDEEMQALVLTYMASSKCRLMLSKKAIPNLDLSGAYFGGIESEDDNWYLACYDYGESYGIEIPLSTLALGQEAGVDLTTVVIY